MVFLIQQTMLYAIPLMIVALAGIFAERSGVINLALEGIMIIGAFCRRSVCKNHAENQVFTQEQGSFSCFWPLWYRPYSEPYFRCF